MSKLLRELEKDPAKNLYAIWDLTRDPDNTRVYACFDNERMIGYLLLYSGLSHPMAILETESDEAGSRLLDALSWEEFAILLSPRAKNVLVKRFGKIWNCLELEMSLTSNASLSAGSKYQPVRLLPTETEELSKLYPDQMAGSRNPAGYAKWLREQTIYGVFIADKLVSVGGTYVESESGWVLGGLYTDPAYRRMGLGIAVASALTIEGLKRASRVVVQVESTNNASLSILEKLGYQKTRELVFADIGTGVRPLMAE
jgi:ribosomal protein S18 acetylase RimI-like enzyme